MTGETADDADVLAVRANALIAGLGKSDGNDPATGLSAAELAGCVMRTLALPEIFALRPELVPEITVYAANEVEGGEQATFGIADALTIDPDGRPAIIVDWKSDVSPDTYILEHYRAQVRAYLEVTGAKQGLIVLMTTGQVLSVAPSDVTPVSVSYTHLTLPTKRIV